MAYDNAFERGNHQYVYAPAEPAKYSLTKCAGAVRWSKDDKLQQEFLIEDFVGSSPVGTRTEWRDVPIEDA